MRKSIVHLCLYTFYCIFWISIPYGWMYVKIRVYWFRTTVVRARTAMGSNIFLFIHRLPYAWTCRRIRSGNNINNNLLAEPKRCFIILHASCEWLVFKTLYGHVYYYNLIRENKQIPLNISVRIIQKIIFSRAYAIML